MGRRAILGALVAGCCLWGAAIPSARAGLLTGASASSATRQQAIHALPLDRLTPEAQQKIVKVVTNPSLFRRMPVSQIDCDPQLYRFLIRNPEVVVSIWRLMGITRVSLARRAEYLFDAADGMGTTASAELIYGDQTMHIYYCEGQYDGPLVPRTVTGRCVLVLNTMASPQAAASHQITACLDIFLQVDQLGAEVITKTLQPVVGRSADRNFVETLEFIERIWRTAAENGPGMQRLAARLPHVSSQQRQQFAQLSAAIYARAAAASPVAAAPAADPTHPAASGPTVR